MICSPKRAPTPASTTCTNVKEVPRSRNEQSDYAWRLGDHGRPDSTSDPLWSLEVIDTTFSSIDLASVIWAAQDIAALRLQAERYFTMISI